MLFFFCPILQQSLVITMFRSGNRLTEKGAAWIGEEAQDYGVFRTAPLGSVKFQTLKNE